MTARRVASIFVELPEGALFRWIDASQDRSVGPTLTKIGPTQCIAPGDSAPRHVVGLAQSAWVEVRSEPDPPPEPIEPAEPPPLRYVVVSAFNRYWVRDMVIGANIAGTGDPDRATAERHAETYNAAEQAHLGPRVGDRVTWDWPFHGGRQEGIISGGPHFDVRYDPPLKGRALIVGNVRPDEMTILERGA